MMRGAVPEAFIAATSALAVVTVWTSPVAAFEPDERFAVRIELDIIEAQFCAEQLRSNGRGPQPKRGGLFSHQSLFSRMHVVYR